MRKVRTKTGHISALARCSRLIISSLLILIFINSPVHALSVSGIPEWLEGAVSRSLNAVWNEIPDSPEIDRYATLELVAKRLFAGYDVKVSSKRDMPAVIFFVNDEIVRPDVKIIMPELRGMSIEWFNNDISGLSEDIAEILDCVPVNALTWADEALRERVNVIINERLPGWEFSQQIYISSEAALINISFRPSSKMILALKPEIYSRTIPSMFRTDLEAKLLSEFSPLIGIPVEWSEKHKAEIERHARLFLEDRNAVDNMRAQVNINFHAQKISGLEAVVDSQDFMFQLWVDAYAGIENKYPELGAFFGLRSRLDFHPEVYIETIFSLDDFDVVTRFGTRFELMNNFFAGVEIQWPESEYFLRMQYIPVKIRRPYAWWRWSPELKEHEAAFGYRVDEHVSIEIYYDSKNEDKIGLRGMWHL